MTVCFRRCPALAALIGAVMLSAGCTNDPESDTGTAAPQASSAVSASPAPSPSPVPEPSPDPRSPTELAKQVIFTSPTEEDPAVQDAVDGYADFLRQYAVAAGLAQPDYPPLIARIDPPLAQNLLFGLRKAASDGEYQLGPLTETVTDSAGGADRGVLIDTCTDFTQRKIYRLSTGQVDRGTEATKVRSRVTMTKTPTGWVMSQRSNPTEQNCA